MKIVKGYAVLFLMLFISIIILPLVSSERDSLRIVIISEDRIYRNTDIIQIEVYVYDKGQLTDAEHINVTLDTRWQISDIVIPMSRISLGIYQGSYEVKENDHHAYFIANVKKGNDNDSAELDILIYSDQLQLNIHFTHQQIAYTWPGENLTATVITQYQNELVDVDDFNYLRLVDPFNGIKNLTRTRKSLGTYEVSISIPNIRENGNFRLEVEATYVESHASANAFIEVNIFTVWYNMDSIFGNTATFTLGVADRDGKGIPGSQITIEEPQERTVTADGQGIALFSLTDVWNGIPVIGKVSYNESNQSFEGKIFTVDPEEKPNPSRYGFDMIYEGSDHIYPLEESITRKYRAYNSTLPLQNREIHYYITFEGRDIDIGGNYLVPAIEEHIHGTSQVLGCGNVTTNQFGDFSITFQAPSTQGQVYIHFETSISRHQHNYNPILQPHYDHDDGLVYEESLNEVLIVQDNLWNDEDIIIESEPLTVGGKTKIKIRATYPLGSDDYLFAKWMPGVPSENLYSDPFDDNWVCWVKGGDIIFLRKGTTANEFIGHTIIPDFTSKDENYTIIAGHIDGSTGHPHFNHLTLKEGESAQEKDSQRPPLILYILVVILITILIGMYVNNQRKRKKS